MSKEHEAAVTGKSMTIGRLQALFEHCAEHTITNGVSLDFDKNEEGAYVSEETCDLFSLWLSGHNQGVADHAVMIGGIRL